MGKAASYTPATSNAGSTAAAGIIGIGGNARSSYLDTAAELTRPQFYRPDYSGLENLAETQTKLGTLSARRVDRELNPERAAARKEAESRILGLLDTDSLLQNQLSRAGLEGAFASGNAPLGDGTFGNTIAQNIYGRGFMEDYIRRLAIVQQFLDENPELAANFTAEELLADIIGRGDNEIQAINERNVMLSNLMGQLMSDSLADGGNALMAGVAEHGANVNAANQAAAHQATAKNASRAATLSLIGQGLGAAARLATARMAPATEVVEEATSVAAPVAAAATPAVNTAQLTTHPGLVSRSPYNFFSTPTGFKAAGGFKR